jgi:hypothetical protein
MAKATETTATARGRQLQATVPQDVYDAYNEYHWEARKDVVDVVREALIKYGVEKGFLSIDADGNPSAVAKA